MNELFPAELEPACAGPVRSESIVFKSSKNGHCPVEGFTV